MARTEPRPAGVVDAQTALGFLAQASGVLAGSLDYERTLTDIARLAVPDLADWCAVDVIEPDGSLRQVTSLHPNPELEQLLIELRRRYRAEKGATEGVQHVVATGEPELYSDVTGAQRARLEIPESEAAKYEQLAPRSYLIVPLVARGRTIGALTLLSTREGRYYNEGDLDFAMHLARRFALAVDNSRLYEAAERARSVLDTVFTSVPVGLAFFDNDLRCVRVNEALAQMTGRPEDYYVGYHASELWAGRGPEVVEMFERVIASGEPVVDYELSGATRAIPESVHSWLLSCAPIAPMGRDPIGIGVAVTDVTERRALLERERADRRRAAFLVRVGEILESSLDYATTLRNVARLAAPELADWCVVHIADDSGGLKLMAVAHADPEKERLAWELEERFPPDPSQPSGVANVVRTGTTEVTNDITAEMILGADIDSEYARILAGLGIGASVIAPLRARGRTLGTITLVAAESGRKFGSEDVALVEELARRFALAADNARLYTERTRIAHALQAELLPSRLPAIPGVRVAVRYHAAGELNEVGGDFYDVFERRDGGWAFVIGDVSGKGAEAAAVTALARHTVRTAALQPSTPAQLLETLNAALLAQRAGSEFCTVCVARLQAPNGSGGSLSVALGGHPPALVLRADGRVEPLGDPGTLLGVFDDPRLSESSSALAPGDLVLLYTDGVTEAGPPGREIGEDGLAELLSGLGGRSPDEVVDAIERAAVNMQEGRPRDDIALVAFQLS